MLSDSVVPAFLTKAECLTYYKDIYGAGKTLVYDDTYGGGSQVRYKCQDCKDFNLTITFKKRTQSWSLSKTACLVHSSTDEESKVRIPCTGVSVCTARSLAENPVISQILNKGLPAKTVVRSYHSYFHRLHMSHCVRKCTLLAN